ncbi:hypothetical protein [Thioalkalivibrio sp. ALE19]|uniref:hypothetical protein n=1 Tax=Thioalkalivibrio sp. ALE19 TaxID=1266909 RepID=UPI0004257B2D|nr:hypothetical protein [Thioalkalivibrio sp. ALE19]
MDHRDIRYMMRHPRAMMRFQTQGETPHRVKLQSPLINLLRRIPAPIRAQMRGVSVHPDLGYRTQAQFHTAEQLLRWLAPDSEVFEGEVPPSERMRDPRFTRPLTLDDLRPFVSDWPEYLDTPEFRRTIER